MVKILMMYAYLLLFVLKKKNRGRTYLDFYYFSFLLQALVFVFCDCFTVFTKMGLYEVSKK